MEKIDVQQVKRKILEIIGVRGPSLPVHVSRETGISMLFSSALLSELFSEDLIKISNLKVGGSPLYFIPGQEQMLEKFHEYLPSKEKEAFLILKNKKILKDSEQHPAIRVAIRNIKDFAFAFAFENEIYWRFLGVNPQEIKTKTVKPEAETKLKKPKTEREKPILELKEPKLKKAVKEKLKSPFVLSVLSFLENKDIPIIEEKDMKKKEFVGKISINSDIGKIRFLCIAKDKKRVTENDFALALQKAQSEKLPVLFISPGEPNKKAETYLESTSLIKFMKLQKQ